MLYYFDLRVADFVCGLVLEKSSYLKTFCEFFYLKQFSARTFEESGKSLTVKLSVFKPKPKG